MEREERKGGGRMGGEMTFSPSPPGPPDQLGSSPPWSRLGSGAWARIPPRIQQLMWRVRRASTVRRAWTADERIIMPFRRDYWTRPDRRRSAGLVRALIKPRPIFPLLSFSPFSLYLSFSVFFCPSLSVSLSVCLSVSFVVCLSLCLSYFIMDIQNICAW